MQVESRNFEYRVVRAYSDRIMEAELELHGDLGWELVYAYEAAPTGFFAVNPAAQVLIFKRERKSEEEPARLPPG